MESKKSVTGLFILIVPLLIKCIGSFFTPTTVFTQFSIFHHPVLSVHFPVFKVTRLKDIDTKVATMDIIIIKLKIINVLS